jgi:hypothetical protein
MTLSEDCAGEETAEDQKKVSQSTDVEEDIEALTLRLQLLKQELTEIRSSEDSEGSSVGLYKNGQGNDVANGNVGKELHEKEITGSAATDNNISCAAVVSPKKNLPDIQVRTEKYESDEAKAGVVESVSCETKDSSDVTKSVDVVGDSQIIMCSKTVGPVDGSGDGGNLGGVEKIEFEASNSSGKEEVMFDECDMEIGGYEEIGVETVGDVFPLDLEHGLVLSDFGLDLEAESSSGSKKSSKKQSKSNSSMSLENKTGSLVVAKSVEKGKGSNSNKEEQSTGNRVEKTSSNDSKKKLTEERSTDSKKTSSKEVKSGKLVDEPVVEKPKKSKTVKKSKASSLSEAGRKDQKVSKENERESAVGAVDTEQLVTSESCDIVEQNVADPVKHSSRSISAWKMPKLSRKKGKEDTKTESPDMTIAKSSDALVNTANTRSEKPVEKSVTIEHSGKASTATKSAWRIPKLSKKTEVEDGKAVDSGKESGQVARSDVMSESSYRISKLSDKKSPEVTETGQSSNLSQLTIVQTNLSGPVKKLEPEFLQGACEELGSKNTENAFVDSKATSTASEISKVSEKLKEVKLKEPVGAPSSNLSSEKKQSFQELGSKGGPEPEKKCVAPKPQKSRKTKVATLKQPDPVREQLELAGELSAAHYLKGRLHERHVNKLFLRGDNIAMINLL